MPTESYRLRSEGSGGRPHTGRPPSERRGIAGASPGARLAEMPSRRDDDAAADRRIRSLVEDRLEKFGPLVTEQIEVSVKNGRVILSGAVGSHYERQAILHAVEQVAYVKHLRSNLRIEGEGDAESPPSILEKIEQNKVGLSLASAAVAAALWWLATLP